MPTIFALLIGISRYPAPIAALPASVPDTREFGAWLQESVASEHDLNLQMLLDSEATWQATQVALRDHLGKAEVGDVAFFYFHGHGSALNTPLSYASLAPRQDRNTLVCYDSRQPSAYDLADGELQQLFAEMRQRGVHTVVILDCCHAARSFRGGTAGASHISVEPDPRPHPFLQRKQAFDRPEVTVMRSGGSLQPKPSIVLAACREEETAQGIPGQPHAVFTNALLRILRSTAGRLTYYELYRRANVLVQEEGRFPQSPCLEAFPTEEMLRPFLGGMVGWGETPLLVHCDAGGRWFLNRGTLHGLPPVLGEEPVEIALYAEQESMEANGWSSPVLGYATLTGEAGADGNRIVPPHQCRVQMPLFVSAVPGTTYRAALLTPLPSDLTVRLEGSSGEKGSLRQALEQAGRRSGAFRLLDESNIEPDFVVLIHREGYDLRWQTGNRLIASLPQRKGEEAVEGLMTQAARWVRLATLANPAPLRLRPHDLSILVYKQPVSAALSSQVECLYASDSEVPSTFPEGALCLDYTQQGGHWLEPRIRLCCRNRRVDGKPLYVATLCLSDDFTATSLLNAGCIRLRADEVWEEPIRLFVTETKGEEETPQTLDLFKIIVCTKEFDVLPLEVYPAQERSTKRSADLSRGQPMQDWMTFDLRLTTRKPSPQSQE